MTAEAGSVIPEWMYGESGRKSRHEIRRMVSGTQIRLDFKSNLYYLAPGDDGLDDVDRHIVCVDKKTGKRKATYHFQAATTTDVLDEEGLIKDIIGSNFRLDGMVEYSYESVDYDHPILGGIIEGAEKIKVVTWLVTSKGQRHNRTSIEEYFVIPGVAPRDSHGERVDTLIEQRDYEFLERETPGPRKWEAVARNFHFSDAIIIYGLGENGMFKKESVFPVAKSDKYLDLPSEIIVPSEVELGRAWRIIAKIKK